jgi:pilus assembly protein Flp/PilA
MEANMRKLFVKFLSDETGATSIEYSMIAVGIAVAIVAVVSNLGSTVKGSYVSVETAMK